MASELLGQSCHTYLAGLSLNCVWPKFPSHVHVWESSQKQAKFISGVRMRTVKRRAPPLFSALLRISLCSKLTAAAFCAKLSCFFVLCKIVSSEQL